MGTTAKIGSGLLAIVVIYAIWSAEEIEPEPEGPCDTDEFGCVELERNEPILLATMLDRSGPRSDVGTDSFHGVLLAADYIDGSFDGENARFLGREISFVHKDERCVPRGGKYGARELISDPLANGLLAVIGGTCDAGILGVADQIMSDVGVTMISPSATSPYLAGPDRQAFFFRTAHNGDLESVALAEFAAEELQADSAALVSVPHSEGPIHPFARSFLQREGRDVVRLDIDPETPDIQELTEQLLVSVDGHPPDVIYLPSDPRYQLPTIKAARHPELRDVPLIIEEHRLPDSSVLDAMHPRQELFIARPDLDIAGEFYEQKFLRAYRARFGEPTSGYHAHAFDATFLLLRAMEEVAIIETTDDVLIIPRTALRDALADTKNFEGVSGMLTCDKTGDCNPDAPMVVGKLVDGSMRIVWHSAENQS